MTTDELSNELEYPSLYLDTSDPFPYREVSLSRPVLDSESEVIPSSPSFVLGRASRSRAHSNRKLGPDTLFFDEAAISASHILGFASPVHDEELLGLYVRDVSQHGSYVLAHKRQEPLKLEPDENVIIRNGDILFLVVTDVPSPSDVFSLFRSTKVQFQVATDYKSRLCLVRLNRDAFLDLENFLVDDADVWNHMPSSEDMSLDHYGGEPYEAELGKFRELVQCENDSLDRFVYDAKDWKEWHFVRDDYIGWKDPGMECWTDSDEVYTDSDSEETPSEDQINNKMEDMFDDDNYDLLSSNGTESDSAPEEEIIFRELVKDDFAPESESESDQSETESVGCQSRKRSCSDCITIYEIEAPSKRVKPSEPKQSSPFQAKTFLAGLVFGSVATVGALSALGAYIE